MLERLVNFTCGVLLFPFALMYYMNKWLYGFTFAYARGAIKMLRGTF